MQAAFHDLENLEIRTERTVYVKERFPPGAAEPTLIIHVYVRFVITNFNRLNICSTDRQFLIFFDDFVLNATSIEFAALCGADPKLHN